ncbi:MAG TPA: hypothetical protein IAB70_07345, partial [Candidatus Merdicola faecigallinarum]|nr:hypothetical protein [Candidatus Merdicola faecigallinarum]
FVTLKMPAEVEIKNLFVTGTLIDFDVRVKDIDHAVLTNKVRMELRDEETNLILLEEINTNEEYTRKTIEKLETGKTYTLSFYADQYNEGNTDETYEANYLLKELKIVTETGITGNIDLTGLTKKEIGKNLVDMSSEVKWYVYPNFNTEDHYGKEYNEETEILTLGGYGNQRRAVYDLEEYAGQEVTISFQAKLVTKGNNGTSTLYLQNSKKDQNRTKIEGIQKNEWKEYTYTVMLDETGYLGFYIDRGNGVEIKELQIELGDKKTSYEEYQYVMETEILVNLEDRKNEIFTNDYYIKIYKENQLENEYRYQEISEDNIVENQKKMFEVKTDSSYRIDLVVKIGEREYVLDSQEFATKEEKEIKGIRNKEEYLEIQPNGSYILLEDVDLSGGKNNEYRFGMDIDDALVFNGEIDFNGKSITRDNKNLDNNISGELFCKIGSKGVLKNLVLNIKLNNIIENQRFKALTYINEGTIQNLRINLIESSNLPNVNFSMIGQFNYGTIENFIIHSEVPMHGVRVLTLGVYANYGTIQNGYLYGENIQTTDNITGNNRNIGGIVVSNYGTIQNIYSLINIDLNGNASVENVGNIASNSGSAQTSIMRNLYSVGYGKNVDQNLSLGPTIGDANNIYELKNVYYFADEIFQNTYNTKSTELALYDISFQNQILNSSGMFEVDELVQKGYYPRLKLPNCMPIQEYIPLPKITNEDLPDILSTEVLEEGTTRVKVKFSVNNPSGETVTNIKIKDINCVILSQEYQKGTSKVIAELNEPIRCVSAYSVLSITTKGAYNLPYTREFEEGERIIAVEFFHEIQSVADWKEMNTSPTENYKIMKDLNFINEGKDISIKSGFSGKIDGQNHLISNIIISEDMNGLFLGNFAGELKDLNIKNYTQTIKKGGDYGFIASTQKGAKIKNVHIDTSKINLQNTEIGVQVGGFIGRNIFGKIEDSSIKNMTMNLNNATKQLTIGGMIGRNQQGGIESSFIQNLNVEAKEIEINGLGGIIGEDSSGSNGEESNILNCYVEGRIRNESNGNYIGGIIGRAYNPYLIVENCISKVDIYTNGERIGGILGVGDNLKAESNLALGNLYTNKATATTFYRIGYGVTGKNYAYEKQLINGYQAEELLGADQLFTLEELKQRDTYFNQLKFENAYNYDSLEKGILPKLYTKDRSTLVTGQEDIFFDEEKDLIVENVLVEKENNISASIRLEIQNGKNAMIEKIEIEDLEVDILQNETRNNRTYLTLKVTPKRYYDTYPMRKIFYEIEGLHKEQEVEIRIETQFYKELYRYEDWQAIELGTYQNYRLMNNIDFAGKQNIKANVTLARLESEGGNKTLKNINLKLNGSDQG